MVFLVELDVDEFGSLDGPVELFPVPATDHEWAGVPYPVVSQHVPFTWEPGDAGVAPDAFWYPQLFAWVCSKRLYDLLLDIAAADIHLIAEGDLDDEPLFVAQVLSVLDVVDRENSIIKKYPTYEKLQFPAFARQDAAMLASRVFRVPGSLMTFMGERVKVAVEAAGLRGFTFTEVNWSDRDI